MRSTIILVCIILLSSLMFAQTVPQREKQTIIDSLYSNDEGVRSRAIKNVIRYKVTEAVPLIEEIIWRKPCVGLKLKLLEAIAKLDTNNISFFAHTIIDSAGYFDRNFPETCRDSFLTRVEATDYLVQRNDFSTVQNVFDILDTTKSKRGFEDVTFLVLKDIALRSSQYADSAKSLLRKSILNPKLDALYRRLAQLYYEQISAPDAMEILKTAIETDPNWLKRRIFIGILLERNYIGLRELLFDRSQNDIDYKSRGTSVGILMNVDSYQLFKKKFAEPQDYNAVAEQYKREQNDTAKNDMLYYLDWFKPLNIVDSLALPKVLDSVATIMNQCIGYGWIGNQSFLIELDSNLTVARGYIVAVDSNNCVHEIKIFQQKVDEEYRDSLDGDNKFITIEGWKFLYYNAQYILDRLPHDILKRE
jgi:hypothetical protein